MRRIVFVSYSNKDTVFAKELLAELKGLFGSKRVDVWDETKIASGGEWGKSIQEALNNSLAAILLISSDYLTSNYIRQHNLPRLLKNAEEYGVIIRLISVSESSFDLFDLSGFSFLNESSRELIKLGPENRRILWSKLISDLSEADSVTDENELHPDDKAEIDGLIAAIKSRFPGKSEEEVDAIYSMITDVTAKHIGADNQMASVRKISDSESDVTPINIDGLD